MQHIHTVRDRKRWGIALTAMGICAGILLSAANPVAAEIYKWQDAKGVIFYSNKPPTDVGVRILEIFPAQNLSVTKDAEGKVYFLNTKSNASTATSPAVQVPEFTISEEKLKELFPESVAKAVPDASQSGVDMTALTIRLAELETNLEREVSNRLKTQYDYAQAQAAIKNLEQQNELLKFSLARMEQDLQTLRTTVVASDMQIASLQAPPPNQQLAMLTGKVEEVQSSVNTMEQEITTFKGQGLAEKVAALSNAMQNLQTQRDTESGRVLKTLTEYQGLKIDKQQSQLDALKQEMEQLKVTQMASLPSVNALSKDDPMLANLVKKNEFMESVIQYQTSLLKMQNEQIKTIEEKLAAIQPVGTAVAPETGSQGITVVPKIERRRPSMLSRVWTFLKTPPPTVAEEE